MIRLVVVAIAAVGLLLLAAFVGARLSRSRRSGVSIRMQIFLALAAIVFAFAFGLGLLVLDRIGARATLLATEAAREEARAVASLVGGEMRSRGLGIDEVARTFALDREAGEPPHLVLLDASGRPLGADALGAEMPSGTVSVDEPIVLGGSKVGGVRVVKPTIVMRRLLADFAPTVLVISTLLGAVAALAAAVIGRAIATPIEGLTAFAVKVSEGDTGAVPPVAHGREVQRLTQAFDSMRRELEGRPFVEMFAADLSHELKNPVAAIRASAELLDEGALAEPEEARRFVARIRESVARIEALLGELLSLARIEARGVEQPVDVDVGDVAKALVARAAEHGADVVLAADDGARVRGDAPSLARAIGNLVDNAVVHGEPGARVEVAVRREAASIVVSVTSAGEIPKHVRGRIFRRFVTTRAGRGGTGLGLAIVRAVAVSHGGRVELASAGPPRVSMRMTLPSA